MYGGETDEKKSFCNRGLYEWETFTQEMYISYRQGPCLLLGALEGKQLAEMIQNF